MSKNLCSLLLMGLLLALAGPVVSETGDAQILEQLTPAQQDKWNAASEAQRADWRVRWQMRQEQEAFAPTEGPGQRAPNDIGRLRYDTGAPADLFHTNGGNTDAMVGNVFTAVSVTPTTLTAFTVNSVSIYGRSAAATLNPFDPGFSFGSAPAGTTIMGMVYRGAATNVPQSSLAPVAIATVMVPLNFVAAMYQGTFAGSDELGMVTDSRIANNGTMTTPLGFHAFQADFNAGTASGYAAIPGQNAMLRVLGPAIVPVELLTFSAE